MNVRAASSDPLTLPSPPILGREGKTRERMRWRLRLPVLEFRFSLLDERRHALLLVLGREKGVKQPPLEEHPFRDRRLVRAVDRFLRHHHRRDRELRDLRPPRDPLPAPPPAAPPA